MPVAPTRSVHVLPITADLPEHRLAALEELAQRLGVTPTRLLQDNRVEFRVRRPIGPGYSRTPRGSDDINAAFGGDE